MAESQIMSCFVTICSYFTMTASSHGFVIRAEGLCGFQPTNEAGAERKLAYSMPCKEEENDS